MLVWSPKDPDEALIYKMDWSSRLAGDTIVSASFEVSSGNVTLSNADHDSDTLSWVTVSAGTADTKAKVLGEIVTTDGQTLQQTATLLIRAR